jgi:hypothetical protein
MTLNSALLYPDISITNSRSIKAYLFFYDGLYRIVPNDVEPNDAKEIKELLKNEPNIISPIPPEKYVEETAKHFNERYKDWTKYVSGFRDMAQQSNGKRITKLHRNKVYSELVDKFESELGMKKEGEWLVGDASHVAVYMLYLANVISKRSELALVTDYDPAFAIEEFVNYDGQYDYDEIASPRSRFDGNLLGMAYMNGYLPKNFEKLSFEAILNYRDDFKDARRKLLQNLEEFKKKVSNTDSVTVYNNELKYFIQDIKQSVDDYKESLNGLNKEIPKGIVYGVTIAGTFSAFSSIAQLLPHNESLLEMGILFGAIWGLQKRSTKEIRNRKKNEYSYLFHMGCQEFPEVKTIVERDLEQKTKELIFD